MADERRATARGPNNLAARMGRWSARHRKVAIFGWLAFVVIAFVLGGVVGTKELSDADAQPGEAGRAARIFAQAGFDRGDPEKVLIQSTSLKASGPAFSRTVHELERVLGNLPGIADLRSPYRYPRQISKDGRSALIQFRVGARDGPTASIGTVLAAVKRVARAHPGLTIGEYGDASATKAIDDTVGRDFHRAEFLSIPLTLAILLFGFGAFVAAGIPLLLALTAVFATFGLIALPSHILPVANEAPALVLLIGLAVGVDYTMFYLRREREERAAGRSERAALEAAAATSGRSVLISGLTVMTAMAGMFLTGDEIFASFGVATILVVAIAMLGSLTVLPALLSRLGDGVDRVRIPFVGRLRRDDGEGRIWGAIVDRVMRRPRLSAALAAGLLIVLALPALQLRMAKPGVETFPKSLSVVQTYDRMQNAFPGEALPANVVVKAPDVNAPTVQAAIRRLEQRALASGRMYEPITVDLLEQHAPPIQDGDVALCRTDWTEKAWDRFPDYYMRSPYCEPEAAGWLVPACALLGVPSAVLVVLLRAL